MAMFEVVTPDGRRFQVEAPSPEAAHNAIRTLTGTTPPPAATDPANQIVVTGPGGVTVRFPAGTDAATIDRVMREATGMAPRQQGPNAPNAGPVDLTRAGNQPPATPQPVGPDTTGLQWDAAAGRFTRPAPGQTGSRFQVPTDDYAGPAPYRAPMPANDRVVPPLVQGAGRAAADTVGMLPDLANLAANAGLTVADFIAERFGGNVDFRFPMVSDTIANTAADIVEDTTGYRSQSTGEMAPGERMAYDLSRYGGGAGLGGGLMRILAAARPASELPRTLDPLLNPYSGPGYANTLARDTAIGVGAGTGIWGAEQVLGPENTGPISNLLAMIVGGAGGGALYDIPTASVPAAWSQARRGMVDRAIPYDDANATTTRATAEDAARYLQEAAGGPEAAYDASTRLGQVVADVGINGMPMPPLGQATQNLGLARVERATTDAPGGTAIIDRNREITTWAGDELRRIAPDADPNVFPVVAADTIQQRTGAARAGVAAAEADLQNTIDLRRQGAQDVAAAPARRDTAALQIDDTVVNKALIPMSERSRQMYGAVDPRREAMVDVSPVQDLAAEIARSGGQLADPARTIPGGLLRRINAIGKPAEEGGLDIGAAIRDAEVPGPREGLAEVWATRQNAPAGPAARYRWDTRNLVPLFTEEELRTATYPGRFEQNLAATFREEAEGLFTPAPGRAPAGTGDAPFASNFSALARIPLGKGETWRSRALVHLARARAAEELTDAPAPSGRAAIRDAELSDDDPGVLGALGIGRESGPIEVPIGEIVDVLPSIGDAARTAFDNGNPVLGRNLRTLENAFKSILDEAGAAGVEAGVRWQRAQENFRGTLGQTFARPGTVSETLRERFNRDQTTSPTGERNRGTTPPSQTAGQYLRRGRPEDAADLVRVYDQTSDPRSLLPAAQTFIVAEAASKVLVDGVVDPAALSRFVTDWGSVIDAIPGLRQQFDVMLDQAARGEALQGDLARRLTQAQGSLALTIEQVGDSALSIVAGKSPRRAVEALMASPNPVGAARQLRETLADAPGAAESLQRAVADWLFAQVTNSNVAQTTNSTRPPSFSKLVNLTDNPDITALLAVVFDDPQAMNALQRVRAVLDLRGIISAAQGTPGSPTAANLQMAFRLFEAGLRTLYGGFTGGNYARNIRVAFDVLFNKDRNRRVVDLVARAQLDPRIASHLLTLPVAQNPTAWASKLGQLMRWTEFARQAGQDWWPAEEAAPSGQPAMPWAYTPTAQPATGAAR